MKANCIRVRPQWMYEDRHIVGDIPLHALMIPGTHNSGAYDVNFGVSILTIRKTLEHFTIYLVQSMVSYSLFIHIFWKFSFNTRIF